MELLFNCPVPKEQVPIEEFKELNNSWFFSLANKRKKLNYLLLKTWTLALPCLMIIETGSIELKANIPKLIIYSALISFVAPLLLIIRQWLSWSYIFKRLISEKIEYEESGWYDGQIWEKTLEWREKDLLIAYHEVKPIIKNIIQSLKYLLFISICPILLLIILENNIPKTIL